MATGVLILCKRRPQSKDLWERPNGRFYHLAKYLAAAGHQVDLVLLNYRREDEFVAMRDGMTWHSVNLQSNPLHIYSYVSALARQKKVDWFVGFSDTYFGILAVLLARQSNARSLIDAYDNYESYIPWCKPLHGLWRFALRRADAVTAPGENLLKLMLQGSKPGKMHAVLPMSADAGFRRLDKTLARKQLGLPLDKKLVGYCGSAHGTRDMDVFFAAVALLAANHPDYVFVMSGPIQPGIDLPSQVIHLGYLADEQMPVMVNALDVMVSVNKPSAFGNYSYPVKIYEALACGVPVIASATPSVAEVLANDQRMLVAPGDVQALAARVEQLLSGELAVNLPEVEGWQAVAARLDALLANDAH